MAGMTLDARSEKNLKGVHPDLVKVVRRAIDLHDPDPVVTEGVRTMARQRELLAARATRTLNSRHIPGPSGYGHAVDFAFIIGGQVRWDWPLYKALADTMKRAGKELGVPIEWGGDWKNFVDGPHFQLPWNKYPA
jgi:peptidoglycan L-alanyl-D-glutamate endopeptidase CwlK